ncbi:MAG TPA: hypothetical protein VLJ86_16665 [Ramlibacter sp.]|nr:hypothetical protein [Ramlibacter sp.]
MSRPALPRLALAALLMLAALAAHAQSAFCSSDGQPRPRGLLERFVSADCESCWADARTPRPAARELAIDWVAPSARGDDAPLSAAARPEALQRLKALRRPALPEGKASEVRTPLMAAARTLRVAHGAPVNDYVGASISLEPAGHGPWTAWLLLVETVPAGADGSPVERNLVRGVLQPPWDGHAAHSPAALRRLLESRPMRVPEGAQPERLRVVGWVEDARGHIRAISESRCAPDTQR